METFMTTYKSLNKDNLELLKDIYSENVHFSDPVHEINGLDQLTEYFGSLYKNIDCIEFDFIHHLKDASDGYIQWEMTFSHPKLRNGKLISVPGASYLHFTQEGKVDKHRDFFDLGAMLYQHIPILGTVISAIKRRLGS